LVAEKFKKMFKMKLLSFFQLATQILTFQPIKTISTELSGDIRILFLKSAVKAKMLTYVLPTEKRLVVSFWKFFQISATKAN